MKNKLILCLTLFCLLLTLSACGQMTDAVKFKNEYEVLNGTIREKDGKTIRSLNIPKENPFVYKDESDIVNKINNKETFVVYFGFSDCPWCRSMLPSLIKAAKDLNLETIYYVDVKEIRDTISLDDNNNIVTTKEGTKDYYEILKLLDNVLEDYTVTNQSGENISTGEKRIYAPSVVAIIEGTAIKLETGISKNQNDAYMELTDEMQEESYNSLKNVLEIVKNSKNACSIDKKC